MSSDPSATLNVATPADASHPEQIAGYRILGLLGEGGMGRVYHARELHPPRDVALKIVRGLDREALQRFRREAELLASLEHPGIARLYATGDADFAGIRLPWLALEYVQGDDVVTHVRGRRLDLRARVALLIAICRAVHYAHGRGVIHRDLKPGNVLVDADGQPHVLDFGIARLLADGEGMTQAGQVLGTLPYMSPEQLAGRTRDVDVRSDVYALGVIAYELIADRLPHPRLSTSTVMEALQIVRDETPQRLAAIAREARGDLDRVVMKALATDPLLRYASSAEFAADLERVLDHRPVEARSPTVGYLAARFVRRHRALSAAAAAVVLVLAGATFVSLRFALAEAAARAEAEARVAEVASINAFLQRMLVSADPEEVRGRELSVLEVVDAAARELDASALPPSTLASVRLTLGSVYLSLGDAERALQVFDAGTSAQDAPLQIKRGSALVALGRHDEANALVDAVLARPSLPAELRIDGLLVRAQSLGEQDKLEQAEPLLREIVDEAARVLGPEHLTTLSARHNLASVVGLRGNYAEALAIAEDSVQLHQHVFGSDHPQTLFIRNHIGVLQTQLDRLDAAVATFRATLADRTRVLGEAHPNTLNTAQNLGGLLIRTGSVDEGLALIRRTAAQWEAARGAADAKTLFVKNMLAYGLEEQGQLGEAERIYREIIAAQTSSAGLHAPDAVASRNNLAMLLMNQDRLADALAEFDLVAATIAATLPADHPYAGIFGSNRGECLARMGRLQEAQQVLERSHQVLVDKLGAAHARTTQAAERLAAVYDRIGQNAKAAALRTASKDAAPAAGGR